MAGMLAEVPHASASIPALQLPKRIFKFKTPLSHSHSNSNFGANAAYKKNKMVPLLQRKCTHVHEPQQLSSSLK